jgi:Amt family ammonium transporter
LRSADLSFYDETLTSSVPFWDKFFFQLVFCGIAADFLSVGDGKLPAEIRKSLC